jgi:hypothetical protein
MAIRTEGKHMLRKSWLLDTKYFMATGGRAMLVASTIAALAAPAANAGNLLPNGNFQTPAPGIAPGTIVSYTSPPGGSVDEPQSAAADWLMSINDDGGNTITTELVPSTFPNAPAETMMLHVTVSIQDSGLVNYTRRAHAGTLFTCVWVYINHGAVGVGSGLEAYTEPNLILDRQGAWEFLHVGNQGTGPDDMTNTTVIYAEPSRWDANPAPVTDFYVQMATLNASEGACKPF